jgi:tetratricopeptide (TPR) repeat protein
MDSLAPGDRPFLPLANFFVRAGKPDRAERLLAEYDRVVPETIRKSDDFRLESGGLLDLAHGRHQAAIAKLREFREQNGCITCALYEIAEAFEALGQRDSALAAYHALANTPESGPSGRQYTLPNVYYRLGELYEGRGAKEKALEYYGKFVNLWKTADAELQPRVAEAKRRMAALAGEPRRP